MRQTMEREKITKKQEQDNKAVYEKRVIAFLDILGFSTMIKDSIVDTPLRRKIKEAMEIIRATKNEMENTYIRKVTTFSDSAVISYLADEHSSLFYLLLDIIHLQIELGALGIMVRGGIAYGDCYHDGDIVFGPAMNEAYRIESKFANWPRVMIFLDSLSKAAEASVDHGTYTYKFELEEINKLLKADDNEEINNGVFFVDYLSQPQELLHYGDEYLEWLRKFRKAIIDGLNRYSPKNKELDLPKSDAKKIFEKYRYLLKYWNGVVGDERAYLPVPALPESDQRKFREMYQKLVIAKRFPYI